MDDELQEGIYEDEIAIYREGSSVWIGYMPSEKEIADYKTSGE